VALIYIYRIAVAVKRILTNGDQYTDKRSNNYNKALNCVCWLSNTPSETVSVICGASTQLIFTKGRFIAKSGESM